MRLLSSSSSSSCTWPTVVFLRLMEASLEKKPCTWVFVNHSRLLNFLVPSMFLAFLMSAATWVGSAFPPVFSPSSNLIVRSTGLYILRKPRSSPSWSLKGPAHVTTFVPAFTSSTVDVALDSRISEENFDAQPRLIPSYKLSDVTLLCCPR